MLNIFNDLACFFEDCEEKLGVREYSRLSKTSPPTASKLLENYHKEGILKRENFKNYILYFADKESSDFIMLSRIYWQNKLKEVVDYIDSEINNPVILLLDEFSNAEVKIDSEIKIGIVGEKKSLDLSKFEKKINRKISVLWINSLKSKNKENKENKELIENIANCHVLKGGKI